VASWGIVFVISLFVLFLPSDDVPSGFPPGTDKIVHGTLFFALAATARMAGLRSRWVIPVFALYAIGSELLQGTSLVGRDASPWDALADVTGVLLGCWLASRFRRPPMDVR
jgi:VanZ family protein